MEIPRIFRPPEIWLGAEILAQIFGPITSACMTKQVKGLSRNLVGAEIGRIPGPRNFVLGRKFRPGGGISNPKSKIPAGNLDTNDRIFSQHLLYPFSQLSLFLHLFQYQKNPCSTYHKIRTSCVVIKHPK
jgi:hypothetical protein